MGSGQNKVRALVLFDGKGGKCKAGWGMTFFAVFYLTGHHKLFFVIILVAVGTLFVRERITYFSGVAFPAVDLLMLPFESETRL